MINVRPTEGGMNALVKSYQRGSVFFYNDIVPLDSTVSRTLALRGMIWSLYLAHFAELFSLDCKTAPTVQVPDFHLPDAQVLQRHFQDHLGIFIPLAAYSKPPLEIGDNFGLLHFKRAEESKVFLGKVCDEGGHLHPRIFSPEEAASDSAGEFIVKPVLSAAGSGLQKVTGADIAGGKIMLRQRLGRYLIQKYIPGDSYGITCFISRREIFCLSISRQIFGKGTFSWIGAEEVGQEREGFFWEKALPFFTSLRKLGYLGFCGVDVVLSPEEKCFFIDYNPRWSGSGGLLVAKVLRARMNDSRQMVLRSVEGTLDDICREIPQDRGIVAGPFEKRFVDVCLY